MLNVVVVGVPFSPNLGDGLISELVWNAVRESVGCNVQSIDLAGREGLDSGSAEGGGSKHRALALRLHTLGPAGVLDRLYYVAKTKRSAALVRDWANLLDGADVVIVGPGQLLSSRTANFPTKLNLLADALDLCEERPDVCLLGVGADSGGSGFATALLRKAISRLRVSRAVVRDQRSHGHYLKLGGSAETVRIAPDLAVLTSDLIDVRSPTPSGVYVDSVDLASYDDADTGENPADAYRRAIGELIDLTGSDHVSFGSNGLIEDQLFASRLAEECADMPGVSVEVLPPPASAAEIAARADAHAATIGVRLHAVLPALAVGRPVIAPVLTAKAEGVLSSAYSCAPTAGAVVRAASTERETARQSLEGAVKWLFNA